MCVSLIWRQTSESEKLTLVDRQMVRSLRIFRQKWALCSPSFLPHGYKLLPNEWNSVSEWSGKIQWIFMKLILSCKCLWGVCVYTFAYIYVHTYTHVYKIYVCIYGLYVYIYIHIIHIIFFYIVLFTVTVLDVPLQLEIFTWAKRCRFF